MAGDPHTYLSQRRRRSELVTIVALVGAVAMFPGAVISVALFEYVFPAPTLCHGCPGNTPVGSMLSIADGVARCPEGANTSNESCAYAFLVTQAPGNSGGTPLTPGDLGFEIGQSSGALLNVRFTITVVEFLGAGCGLAAYNGTVNSWGASVSPIECHDLIWSNAPIQEGDVFILEAAPQGGLPFSPAGDQLLVIGVGPISGSISARIG
jgi:hypothetical protein